MANFGFLLVLGLILFLLTDLQSDLHTPGFLLLIDQLHCLVPHIGNIESKFLVLITIRDSYKYKRAPATTATSSASSSSSCVLVSSKAF